MSTIVHSPASASQVAVCSPEPEADAAQNVCSPGGPGGAPPEKRRYETRNGSKSRSRTSSWATPSR